MVFSSLIFIWLFLPVTLVLYFVIKDEYRNALLLIVSLIFYAWGEPIYIILMLCSILLNWLIGMAMERYERKKKELLILDIVLNLGMLGYFKYFNFFLRIVYNIAGKEYTELDISLPIGISFFTFQILSYIIDLYRGKYSAQKNLIHLALYISFFPQLIAGPIVKYKDINDQLIHRETNPGKTAEGIRRFIYGMGKKVIVSNILAECVDAVYELEFYDLTGVLAWTAAILYMLQIYYDFSGYSDMAIGLGRMFGFEFQENFNYPYLSTSIREFWQKWHISLGTWFKEYVYIPLGGNRKGTARTYLNLAIIFVLTGLWHGANLTFVLWGIYHGMFQVIERLGLGAYLNRHKWLGHIYTCVVVLFGWVLFRSDNLIQAGVMVRRMLLPFEYTETTLLVAKVFGGKQILIAVIGILGCGIIQTVASHTNCLMKFKRSWVEIAGCSLMMILCIAMLANNTYNPFIYFRF